MFFFSLFFLKPIFMSVFIVFFLVLPLLFCPVGLVGRLEAFKGMLFSLVEVSELPILVLVLRLLQLKSTLADTKMVLVEGYLG